jgi:predicted RNA-binding Zn-ribbon protein involved in translation (DUF1610 family)
VELLNAHWRETWKPKDRRRIYEWLEDHWMLGNAYTKTGLFEIKNTRHLIALFDSYQNERKRETNVCAPTRGGKTLWLDGCHLWAIDIRPANILVLFQEDKAVKDQCEMRTWPNINYCGPVKNRLSNDAQKNRLTEIIFPHMYMHIRGPADSNLQSRGYQDVWVDEPWLLKEGKIEEARARLGDFVKMGTDKFQCLSQGGIVGSEWDRQYNRGLIHEWNIQCLFCGHYMMPRWTGHRPDGTTWGMKWDTHKLTSGLWDVAKCMPTVRFECEKCGKPHIWSTRVRNEWNRTGQYVAENNTEKREDRDSFHWTAIIDTPWEYLADLYLQAINAWKMGTTEPLIKFFQKRMAEMCSEERLLSNSLNFRKAAVEIQKPDDAVRIITADRQEEDVYWVMACDWMKGTDEAKPTVHRIHYGKCFSAAEIEELRIKLGVEKHRVLIDSGFRPKGDHGVYSYCIKYGWIPTKGEATQLGEELWYTHDIDGVRVRRTYSEPIMVDAESGIGGGRYTQLIKFSAPTYTARVQWLIDHGMWIEPESDEPMDKECRRQMAAEYLKEIVIGNKQARRTKKIYVCPSGNNHARDDAKQQILAATLLDILPDLESLDELAA